MAKRYQTPAGRAAARRKENEAAQSYNRATGIVEAVRAGREKREQESKERNQDDDCK